MTRPDLPPHPTSNLMHQTVTALILALQEFPHREVYRAELGGYSISHAGGLTSRDVIDAAERQGLIRRKWPDSPEIDCWVLSQPSDAADPQVWPR